MEGDLIARIPRYGQTSSSTYLSPPGSILYIVLIRTNMAICRNKRFPSWQNKNRGARPPIFVFTQKSSSVSARAFNSSHDHCFTIAAFNFGQLFSIPLNNWTFEPVARAHEPPDGDNQERSQHYHRSVVESSIDVDARNTWVNAWKHKQYRNGDTQTTAIQPIGLLHLPRCHGPGLKSFDRMRSKIGNA